MSPGMGMGEGRNGAGPVEAYLDRLFELLAGTGAAGRRLLAEADDHLRESTEAGVARGLRREDAEREAVTRFGRPEDVAARFGDVVQRPTPRRLAGAAAVVGALGLVALGVSGLLSQLTGTLFGWAFVAGDAPGVTYTPERCAEYLRLAPTAGSCSAAALSDHFGEVVMYRVAVGVLGLLGLGALALLRRTAWAETWLPSRRLVALVGAGAAGVCALGLLANGGLMLLGSGAGHGAGMTLDDGIVAALTAVAFAVVRLRAQRAPGRETSPVR